MPLIYQTDGEWVWSSETSYYLREHDIAPDPDFLNYLRSREYRYIEPSSDRVQAASQAVKSR